MKTSKMFITIVTALAMASCNNDKEFANQPELEMQVPEAYASFSISIPHTSGTRSVTTRSTEPGTDAENIVKSLHIFIYDKEAPFTSTVAEFSVAANTLQQAPGNTSQWITTRPVNTKKADKYIFAAVNLNTEIVDYITSNGLGAFNYKEFTQEVGKLADQTNGFIMFNENYPNITPATNLYEDKAEAEKHHISIPVSRVTAKSAVFTSPTFKVKGGGSMTDLKFGWRNLNKKFYFIQDSRDGIVKDYNWNSYTEQDFSRGTDAINVYGNDTPPSVFSYAPENTFQYVSGTSNVNESTFISISGVFTPAKIVTSKNDSPTGESDFTIENNTSGPGTTFYVVHTADGTANYFIDGAIAEKYAELCANNTTGMPALTGDYVLADNTYTNGICYFHVQVNGNVTAPQAPYNIYRNQYFKITVNSIQAPGKPSDNFDNNQPIQPNTWISADIEVIPWDYTVLGLKFRYATNKSIHQQTEFPPNAMLAVFIFDDKGTFVSQINDSLNQVNDDYTMKLPFKQGSYQFVAWTGYDETCYQLSACIPQQTDIHDFFLSLKREKDNQTINQPSLLYHGIHDIVKIREGKENIVWIDLKQITNHIQVIVHNLNDKKKHIIYIEDNNGKYDSFLQYADDEKITYLPTYSNPSNTTSSLIADFTVMKLDKNREPRLKISDDTGVIRYDENLIGKLLQKKPYIDFDYNHDFTIEISFNDYIPVSIKINGWEIINESV